MTTTSFVIHAGFHKTGTSSVQAILRKNRNAIEDEFRILLRDDIPAICACARAYSVASPKTANGELALFTYEVADFISGLDLTDPRPIVISAEDLCGHMPGRHGLKNYDRATSLLAILLHTIHKIAPQNFDFNILISTRSTEGWIKSCYAQHLRASRLCDDFPTYQAAHLARTDLAAWAQNIRDALTPIPVIIAPLEHSQTRKFGPFAPLLDLMQPSASLRAALYEAPIANAALAPEILAQLRALNQGNLDNDALAEAKKSLIQGIENA